MSHVTTYLAELHSLSLCAETSIQVVPKEKKIKSPISVIKCLHYHYLIKIITSKQISPYQFG